MQFQHQTFFIVVFFNHYFYNKFLFRLVFVGYTCFHFLVSVKRRLQLKLYKFVRFTKSLQSGCEASISSNFMRPKRGIWKLLRAANRPALCGTVPQYPMQSRIAKIDKIITQNAGCVSHAYLILRISFSINRFTITYIINAFYRVRHVTFLSTSAYFVNGNMFHLTDK